MATAAAGWAERPAAEPKLRSMESIRNHFEQRADLDAFWSADVDFSRDRLGLSNTAQKHVRQTSRPRVLTGAASKELPSEDQEPDAAEMSWMDTAHKQTTWDFEAVRFPSTRAGISGTLRAGLTALPDVSSTVKGTGAFDHRKISELSVIGEGTMYPAGHTALDADDTVDVSHTVDATHNSAQSGTNSSSLNFNPLFGEDEELGECAKLPEGGMEGGSTEAVKDLTMAGHMRSISEQLLSSTSPVVIIQACEHLTALVLSSEAAQWTEPVSKMVISCLLPHVAATSNVEAHVDAESVGASMAAITSLCAIASHGNSEIPEQLAKQGAVSAAVSAAQAMLAPGPEGVSGEAYNRVSAIIKGAVLPIVREGPAAKVLACTQDAAAQPPLHALASLGGMILEFRGSSDNDYKAQAAVALLSVLQCAHAMFSHGNLELLNASCKAGLFQLAIDTYALSHNPSVLATQSWELRKALAVIAEISVVFQAAEEAPQEMLCSQDVRQHAGQVSLLSVALKETIDSSSLGSTSALLRLLVEDVKLRDREHLASMSILALHSLAVHCGLCAGELSCRDIVSICAAGDGKALQRVDSTFIELLIQIWGLTGDLEGEEKVRARTAMARTLGRQQNLSSDALAFIRQHVVGYCVNMLDWEATPSRSQFAYYLRSFAKQYRVILKDLASGAFVDNMAAAAAGGHDSVAVDVLLDLAARNSRVAKRAAQCCVLEQTQELLFAASSSASAIKGILAISFTDKHSWQELLQSLQVWLTAAHGALKADDTTTEDALRTVQLTAACIETLQRTGMEQKAGSAAEEMPAAKAAAADLAVGIVAACRDASFVASSITVLPLLEPSEACLRQLCAPKVLAEAIHSLRPIDAYDANAVFSSTLCMGAMHDGLVFELLIQGDISKACLQYMSVVLDQWDKERQERMQGLSLSHQIVQNTGDSNIAEEDTRQEVQTMVLQHGDGEIPDLVPLVPVVFVQQAAALHTAARLCMAITQAAEVCSARLLDPVLFLGKFRVSVLQEIAASSRDVRLKRMLEATDAILKAASNHHASLRPAAPDLKEQLVDATSTLVVKIQAGTTHTVSHVQEVWKQWRASPQVGEMQPADSIKADMSTTHRSPSASLKAGVENTSLLKTLQNTGDQVVAGARLQAERAREMLSGSIKRG